MSILQKLLFILNMRNTVKAIVPVVFLLCVYLGSFSQQVAKSIPNSTSPDGLIGFLEFRPRDYGSQKHPLIIFLHGIGERGNGTTQINAVANNAIPMYCAKGATMRFTVGGQTSSFVVLSPQLSSSYGYWPTFYVREMIKYAKANLSIDPNRIYITGLSLGGGGTWRAITDATGFDYTFDAGIAAAAPVCGTQEETDADVCPTIGANHLPIWAFHSMDDGTVGVGATQHAEILLNNCNMTPKPKFTYYQSGGHSGAWVNAYDTGHITTNVVVNGVVQSFTANPNLYEWFLSNTRSVTTTPAPTLTAPVANAGAAQSITLPLNSVTLSGTSSTGTNGATIASYSWKQVSGPSSPTISNLSGSTTSVSGLVAGIYTFSLTVTDNNGLTNTANTTVTVNAALSTPSVIVNQAPVSNAGAAVTITLPTNSVTLDGSASYDPDGSIVQYYWKMDAGPGSAIGDIFGKTTTASNLSAGTYTFLLQVKDNSGAVAYSTKTVTVNPAVSTTPPATTTNASPVSSAGAAATITLPTNSITLDGSGSFDPDGSIVQYYWTITGGPAGATIADNFAVKTTASNLSAGTYTFLLQVKDNAGALSYATKTVVVNAAAVTSGQPLGYIRLDGSADLACADASTSGRIAVYGSSIANGTILYTDAAKTQVYNGGWNWFSFTPTLGSATTAAFAVYPNGAIFLLKTCSAAASAPAPAPGSNLLGYVKLNNSPLNACADASTSGRIAVYGTGGIANGAALYTDAAMTQKFDGGWNWYSFTPTLGGPVTVSFAIYPIGTMGQLFNCSTGARTMASGSSVATAEADLQRMKDSANGLAITPASQKLTVFPNPVHNTATLRISTATASMHTVSVYSAAGVLVSKVNWQTTAGLNSFELKSAATLSNGLYILEVRDSKGNLAGTVKFLKM